MNSQQPTKLEDVTSLAIAHDATPQERVDLESTVLDQLADAMGVRSQQADKKTTKIDDSEAEVGGVDIDKIASRFGHRSRNA